MRAEALQLTDTFSFVAAHLAPAIRATFPFHAAKDALRTLDSATHFGKIVITLHDASN